MITHSRILEAQRKHPRAAGALDYWYRLMKRGHYANFATLKATFGSVDKVGPLLVFNIAGNSIRLITAVHFNSGKVFVRHVLSHAEYDSGRWKQREGLQ